jgi:cytochrome c biogenesis protein CcmG/thiol:disulfide interchange protein DsbE
VCTGILEWSLKLNKVNWKSGIRSTLLLCIVAFSVAATAADGLQIDDYKGKVIVLDFWASWCVPCRRSFPWMNDMQRKYGDKGFVVIAVNLDSQASDAREFLQKYPAEFSVFYDTDRQLAKDYGVEAMPSSFLINRDGEIVARHLGFKTSKTDEYEASIVATVGSQN